MLWVDFFDVHEPWFPPEYLLRMYQTEYDGEPMAHPNYHSADVYSKEELENLRARYAAMCTLLSKNVGRIFRLIEDTGLFDNSIVLFLSDHGMYLGEHGLTGKSLIHESANDVYPFHPEVARICWSMSIPSVLDAKASKTGARFSQLIQAPDLMPTILDLCGIEVPEKARLEGMSLVPLLRGQTDASPRGMAMTASTTRTHHQRDLLHCRHPALTDGEWTLILREPPEPGPPLLYNTGNDPSHKNDLFSEGRDEAGRLHKMMLDFLRDHEATPATLDRLSAENVGLG